MKGISLAPKKYSQWSIISAQWGCSWENLLMQFKKSFFFLKTLRFFSNPFLLFSFTGKRYEPLEMENAYKVIMKLTINSVSQNDFGSYKCVSKNSLGDTDGTIKLYRKYLFG